MLCGGAIGVHVWCVSLDPHKRFVGSVLSNNVRRKGKRRRTQFTNGKHQLIAWSQTSKPEKTSFEKAFSPNNACSNPQAEKRQVLHKFMEGRCVQLDTTYKQRPGPLWSLQPGSESYGNSSHLSKTSWPRPPDQGERDVSALWQIRVKPTTRNYSRKVQGEMVTPTTVSQEAASRPTYFFLSTAALIFWESADDQCSRVSCSEFLCHPAPSAKLWKLAQASEPGRSHFRWSAEQKEFCLAENLNWFCWMKQPGANGLGCCKKILVQSRQTC